ncbi:hypothetical protein ACHWQZ_G001162 [Mnemiopsis leidyi]
MAGSRSCFYRYYNWWVLTCVCLGSMAMGLPFFSYGALLPYLSSLFYYTSGKVTSQAAMALQPVILLVGITLTGSLSGILEYYMNVRLLNFLLSTCFVLVVGFSYFIDSYVVLTVVAVLMGSLAGQINVCNVARLSEWNPRKSGAANGIMGFFMGMSGLVGSVMCSAVINPYNKEPEVVNTTSGEEVLFVDEYVNKHTRDIWVAWAATVAVMFLPGVFILRPPTPEEVCTQDDILSGDSFESVELLPRSKAAGPDYGVKDLFKSPKFYVLYLIILILSLTLLTSTELYKFIGIEAINDDKFLNLVGALGAVANAFGRVTWGLILDRFGTRATYTVAFFIQGPLTIALHYSKWNKWGYLANICVVCFCTGIFTCIAPACQELFGSRDISLKYALTLSAESFGCILFFFLQLGQEYFYGESVFLTMMGAPSILAAILAFFCFR